MISKLKPIFISIFIILGLMYEPNAQGKQKNPVELRKTFSNALKEYQKMDSSGIVIITQKDDDLSTFRFSRLESQEMLLKNKPSSYFFVNKKLILFYRYEEIKENVSFDSTETDKKLFNLLVVKSNRKLVDDFPKSKYLIISTYNPTEWIVRINEKGSGVYDKEATIKLRSGNPRWKI
jgi:hypothetical protein